MANQFQAKAAVMLFLFRKTDIKTEILLQRRWNTGYGDGMWECCAAGHVEQGESMEMALVREAKEEIGITIDMLDIRFGTFIHKYTPATGSTYLNAFFTVTNYRGLPSIMEPEKCSDLQWFDIDALPKDFLPDRMKALANYRAGIPYDEEGWSHAHNS